VGQEFFLIPVSANHFPLRNTSQHRSSDSSEVPMTEIEMITVGEACRIIGGDEPIHAATYYRGVRAGRYPRPVHVSPGVARVPKEKLLATLAELIGKAPAPLSLIAAE
jgi:hypothetical protein